ncbi:MAG: cytochrome b/b6 domain-containing protein [Vicinamibacteria bacterium]
MSFFQWAQNPWGQEILVRISWDLFWLALGGGALFVIGHLVFRSKHKEAPAAEVPAAKAAGIPDKIVRHSFGSRFFHWSMTLAVFTLLVTGFFPVLGIHFDWITIHWIAGLALIGTVIFHIIHATFWLRLRNIWIGSADWREFRQEIANVMGTGAPPPKPGKYPVDQRLFHHLVSLATFGVILTGLFMMVRVENPLFNRNPYLFSDSTWGWVYALHGLSAVGLVGMIVAHVYFAILPEKRWMTMSMIAGWITKKDYLTHHDPDRWVVKEQAKQP